MKTFTVRDERGNVVAGLENVAEGNALLRMVAYDKALSSLAVDETAHGTHGYSKTKEEYFVTRTA